MPTRFHWITFDVSSLLPPHWQQDAVAVAREADFRKFPRTPILTREAQHVQSINRGRVHAHQVRDALPWLYDLYLGTFRDLAQEAWKEPVVTANDKRYALVLNVQSGRSMRFECHVDSNPLTGLLFCTTHVKGGELVVSSNPSARSIADVERDCSIIRPQAGYLVFFDARAHPHYARPLLNAGEVRVLANMNFYTDAYPESTRPRELNAHLYGDPLEPAG
jgi:2OG-Fe(II) oxygenase superfamily